MRIVFAGTPEPAVVALQRLLASPHEVVAVLTRPDARKGRGRTMHPSPVKALAQAHGIDVMTPQTLRDNVDIAARLRELKPAAIPVVAYGSLVPTSMLDIPTHGWVNLHYSLLPNYRGAAPVQAAIIAGETTTGATTFRIDEGLDTGDILGSIEEPIRPTDTADDLLARLAICGADLLVETMDQLAAGAAKTQPQPEEGTYAPKLTADDARVNWNNDAVQIERAIRAYTSAPGAWTTFGGQRFKLGPVKVAADDACEKLPPGVIRPAKKEVEVGTATTPVVLEQVQPPGKRSMHAADWARGLREAELANGVMFE